MANKNQFRFKSLDSVGVADASEDRLLRDCFIDTGYLEALVDCSSARRIIIGRTGVGKTALLKQIENTQDRVIVLPPENLALAYISNSTILSFVAALGVRLDVFYKLLWRHVFVVEIIKSHYKIIDQNSNSNFLDNIKRIFRDKKHTQAMEYLRQWGEKFWLETDDRITELITKLETDVKSSIGSQLSSISISAEGAKKLSEEQKHEIVQRVQFVVNQVQIRQLTDMMDILNQVLDDRQQNYYIIVDRLDENWIEDKIRYLLIRALIETVRDFNVIRQAKVIIALRRDLIDRVFAITRDTGFQEEKYEDLYLDLRWTKQQLISVLDARINHLVAQRYTKQEVSYQQLLPKTIEKQQSIDYILERTLMRPRDVISFFNHCIVKAVDTQQISGQMLKDAERDYSKSRLISLEDEWQADYPFLSFFVDILRGRFANFKIQDITDDNVEELCIEFACKKCERVPENCEHQDHVSKIAHKVAHNQLDPKFFRGVLIEVFYHTGLIGLKLIPNEPMAWCSRSSQKISASDTSPETSVTIHKCFWRALNIRPGEK